MLETREQTCTACFGRPKPEKNTGQAQWNLVNESIYALFSVILCQFWGYKFKVHTHPSKPFLNNNSHLTF